MSTEDETEGSATPDPVAPEAPVEPPADPTTPPPPAEPEAPVAPVAPPPEVAAAPPAAPDLPPGPPPPGNDGTPTTPPARARRCTGKLPPRIDPRTLRLARYLPTSIAPAPVATDWSKAASPNWGMMDNDTLGCCTCSACGHARQTWTANNGPEVTPPDADVQAMYEAVGGYNPADPSTDQGAVELVVLNYFRNTGLGGVKIRAFVALDPKNREHVRQSVFLFGGCYIGLQLPQFAQNQDVTWTIPAGGDQGSLEPGSWGGHAVWVFGYDADWVYFVSWGQPGKMSWAFWNEYCDESYALLSDEWCSSAEAPSKFDLAQLEADLNQVGDPASSSDTATAAAAQQARRDLQHRVREGTAPEGALKVTRSISTSLNGPNVGTVTAVGATGTEVGVSISVTPGADPSVEIDLGEAIMTFRLSAGGQRAEARFKVGDLREFIEDLGWTFDALTRRPLPSRPAPSTPET